MVHSDSHWSWKDNYSTDVMKLMYGKPVQNIQQAKVSWRLIWAMYGIKSRRQIAQYVTLHIEYIVWLMDVEQSEQPNLSTSSLPP